MVSDVSWQNWPKTLNKIHNVILICRCFSATACNLGNYDFKEKQGLQLSNFYVKIYWSSLILFNKVTLYYLIYVQNVKPVIIPVMVIVGTKWVNSLKVLKSIGTDQALKNTSGHYKSLINLDLEIKRKSGWEWQATTTAIASSKIDPYDKILLQMSLSGVTLYFYFKSFFWIRVGNYRVRDGKRSSQKNSEEKGKVARNFLDQTKRKSPGFILQDSKQNSLPCQWERPFLQPSVVEGWWNK